MRLSANIAFALCLTAARASAHAPLPRAIAVSPDGNSVALGLPGFGLLLRTADKSGFAYACDALLGIPPSDTPAAVKYFADGSWLLGSSGGLHAFAANGCERGAAHVLLGQAPISAIAIHAASQVAYAIATDRADGVWRSDDQGAHWQRVGSIDASDRVTALLIDDADPTRLYVSSEATLSVSSDGGASFTTVPQTRAIRLLALQTPLRLWGVARALDNKGNRGFDILSADAIESSWQSKLRVNYFGGLTITDNAEVWVGDEGGGVYRSTDQGETFAPVEAPRSVSCLASAGNEVWACTPDLPAAPALSFLDPAAAAFMPSISLASVDTQVVCAQHVASNDPCQAAWIEWQRDVIGRDPVAIELPAPPELQDAGLPAQAPAAPSCAVSLVRGQCEWPWPVALVLSAVVRARRRPRH